MVVDFVNVLDSAVHIYAVLVLLMVLLLSSGSWDPLVAKVSSLDGSVVGCASVLASNSLLASSSSIILINISSTWVLVRAVCLSSIAAINCLDVCSPVSVLTSPVACPNIYWLLHLLDRLSIVINDVALIRQVSIQEATKYHDFVVRDRNAAELWSLLVLTLSVEID